MKYDFLGVGDITVDAFIEIKDADVHENHKGVGKELCFRFGDKISYEDVVEVPAVGNSANASVSASRLGLRSALLSSVGDDWAGKLCLSQLAREGVATEFVRIDEELRSNYHYVLRFGAERTILVKHQEYKYFLPQFEEYPSFIYFSSIGEHALDFHFELADFIERAGTTKLAFQPGTFQIKLGASKLKKVYKNTYIFFCNKEEAQRVLNSKEGSVKELLKGIYALGPKIVVITDGPKGAFAYDGSRFYSVPMYPDIAKPLDRTGAGDAFSSTVTSFLAKGFPLKEALLRGPINSMSVVQYIGAQKGLLKEEAIESYLASAPADYKVTVEAV